MCCPGIKWLWEYFYTGKEAKGLDNRYCDKFLQFGWVYSSFGLIRLVFDGAICLADSVEFKIYHCIFYETESVQTRVSNFE